MLTAKQKKEQLQNNTEVKAPIIPLTDIKPTPKNFSIPSVVNVGISDILSKRIDSTIEIKPIIPTVYIADSRFAVKGDISMISGKPKAGKSTITKMILATALMEEVQKDFDSLCIRSNYCKEKNVI